MLKGSHATKWTGRSQEGVQKKEANKGRCCYRIDSLEAATTVSFQFLFLWISVKSLQVFWSRPYWYWSRHMVSIVGKTRRRRRHVCDIFQASCAIFCQWTRKYFFAFCCANWHIRWIETPCKLKGWSNMPFKDISRYFEANFFLASLLFLRVSFLSVIFFYDFSNCDGQYRLRPKM